MTDRKPLMFSRRAVLHILVPLILQSLLAVAIGTIDTVMISVKSQDAFAGVSLVNQLDVFLVTLFTCLTNGGAVVLSQAMGRRALKEGCETAKQLVYITTIVASVVALVVILLRVPILGLLFPAVDAPVMESAISYLVFLVPSFPFLAIQGSCAAILRIQGDSMTTLKMSLVANLVNIGGNALLIYGFNLDAAGAAIATFVSRALGAVILLLYCCSRKYDIRIDRLFRYRPRLRTIRDILRIGIPSGIEGSMFQIGRLATSSLISTLSTPVINANAATLTLANLQYVAGGAVQGTMVAVVGRCVGAGDKKQAKFYAAALLGTGYALIGAICILLSAAAYPLLSIFHLEADAFSLACNLLWFHSIVSFVLWPTAFCLPSAFQAASDVRFVMVTSVASMWIFRVALAYILTPAVTAFFGITLFSGAGLGVFGIFVAMSVDWLFRAAIFLWRFFSGRWLTKHAALRD